MGILAVESFNHFDPYDCDLLLKCFDEDIDKLTNEIAERKLNVLSWIIGCESGVSFYDKLCHKLDLPYSNDFTLSQHRRNKFLMQEKIKSDGNRGIKQKLISSKEEALDYINNNLTYPLIIKPVDSAGTEGVTLCKSEEDVVHALHRFLGAHNIFGLVNNTMLVQE